MKNLLPTLLAAPLTSLVLPAQAQDMVQWQNIVISAPENLEDTATALAELLIPLTEGNVSFACNNSPISSDCTRIELSERLGPAFAYVAWPEQEYSCIRLILCSSEDKQHILQRFMNGLQPAIQRGKLAPIGKGELRESLMAAVRPQRINWDNIVVANNEIFLAEWFRQNTLANVHVHGGYIDSFEAPDYGAEYLVVQLDAYDDKDDLSITQGNILPTLTIQCAIPSDESESWVYAGGHTHQIQNEALRQLERLRPLIHHGHIPPMTVQELQQYLRSTSAPPRYDTVPPLHWEDITIVAPDYLSEDAKHFVAQLQIVLPGKVSHKSLTSPGIVTAERSSRLTILLSPAFPGCGPTTPEAKFYHYIGSHLLVIRFETGAFRDVTAGVIRALQSLTREGKLPTSDYEEIEQALRKYFRKDKSH